MAGVGHQRRSTKAASPSSPKAVTKFGLGCREIDTRGGFVDPFTLTCRSRRQVLRAATWCTRARFART